MASAGLRCGRQRAMRFLTPVQGLEVLRDFRVSASRVRFVAPRLARLGESSEVVTAAPGLATPQ